MRSFHVLILPSWYPTRYAPLNGVFFQEQARALHKAGVQVGVIYPDLRSLRTLGLRSVLENRFQVALWDEDGIPTVRFHGWNPPSARLRGKLFVGLALRLAISYIERFGKPDLLHAHSVLWGGVAAREVGRRLGIPYVVTEHSSAFGRGLIQTWQEPLIRAAFQDASAVLAVSRSLARLLAPYAGEREIEVLPNMVDTDYFTLPPRPRVLDPFRFLTVAFLTPIKGIDILLRAFARAFKGNNRVVLEIGGDGPDRGALESLARELGVRGQIRFLGLLSREQVRGAMWRANVFVLPSFVETFGVVLIEAMATGLPVIATHCGGPEDFVHRDVGLLSEPGDVENLAEALKVLFQRYAEYQDRERLIRNYVMARFSSDVVANSLLQRYRKLVGEA